MKGEGRVLLDPLATEGGDSASRISAFLFLFGLFTFCFPGQMTARREEHKLTKTTFFKAAAEVGVGPDVEVSPSTSISCSPSLRNFASRKQDMDQMSFDTVNKI